MFERALSIQVDIENFALITHAVPASRVRPHIPEPLRLQTFPDDGGEEIALISSSSFCNRQLHWSLARYPAIDFDQNTYRTYVTYKGNWGSYFFGTNLSTRLSYLAQCAVAAESFYAEFDADIRSGPEGYLHYSCRSVASYGELSFELEATDAPSAKQPFATGREHSDFITYRLHGFSRSPLGGYTHGPILHRRMEPWEGRLHSGRFDFWHALGILEPDEALNAYSVLVEPSVRFTLLPPRPLRVSS